MDGDFPNRDRHEPFAEEEPVGAIAANEIVSIQAPQKIAKIRRMDTHHVHPPLSRGSSALSPVPCLPRSQPRWSSTMGPS